ncbi:uncharacterized protein [Taeniopygia guttata]|uniref:uncharacterized protein n=1 Tax=Taeniopygia guttata TaxID=59729 RepID=UPI003BB8A571
MAVPFRGFLKVNICGRKLETYGITSNSSDNTLTKKIGDIKKIVAKFLPQSEKAGDWQRETPGRAGACQERSPRQPAETTTKGRGFSKTSGAGFGDGVEKSKVNPGAHRRAAAAAPRDSGSRGSCRGRAGGTCHPPPRARPRLGQQRPLGRPRNPRAPRKRHPATPPPPARDPRPRRFAPRQLCQTSGVFFPLPPPPLPPAPPVPAAGEAAAGKGAERSGAADRQRRGGRCEPVPAGRLRQRQRPAQPPAPRLPPARPPGPAQPGKSPRRVPPARLRPPRPPRPRGETPKERDQLTHGSAAGEAGDTSGFRGAGEVNCTEVQVVFSPIRSGRLKEGERGGGGGGGRVSLARSLSHTHAHTHTHTHTEAHACTHAHTHTRTRTRPLGSAPELPQQGGARTENTRAASCPRALWPPPAATPRAPAAAPLGQAALRDYPRFEVADGEKLRYRAGGLRGLGMPGCGQASPGGLCLPAVPLPRRAGSGAESRITVLLLPGVSPGTTCSVTLLENCLYS